MTAHDLLFGLMSKAMTSVSFGVALENAAIAFFTYTFSLIAALSWAQAVQHEIEVHESPWKRWVWAVGITLLALIVIVIFMLFHDTDDDDGRTQTLTNDGPTMGRMPIGTTV